MTDESDKPGSGRPTPKDAPQTSDDDSRTATRPRPDTARTAAGLPPDARPPAAREAEPVPVRDPPASDPRPIDRLRQRIQTPGSPMAAKAPPAPTTGSPSAPAAGAATAAGGNSSTVAADKPSTVVADKPSNLSVDYVPQPVPFDAPTHATGPTMEEPGLVGAPSGAASEAAVDAVPRGPQGATAPGTDDAILPAALDDNALRDAIGAPPARPRRKRLADDGDDGIDKPGGRRALVIAVLALLVGLTLTALVLLGRVNAQRFVIACTTDQVSAEQGRSFPPWGTRPLGGAAWKPITLPPNAECNPRETDTRAQLERWFLDLLVDRASTTLTARDLLDSIQPGRTNPLDIVAEQLNQALLLSRSPDRRDQRKEVERLLGDVAYWRASLRLRDAAAALADAARQFDSASAQRPRHVTDAGQWAAFLRGIIDNLRAGPGAPPSFAPVDDSASERPTAPHGAALPVEADDASAEPAPQPDAGLPTGGVLL